MKAGWAVRAAVLAAAVSALETKAARRGGAPSALRRRAVLGGILFTPVAARADRFDEWKAEKARKERAKAAWMEMPSAVPSEGAEGSVAPPAGSQLGSGALLVACRGCCVTCDDPGGVPSTTRAEL